MSLLRNVNTRSVEDMYGLLGRSPSEAEFQLFLSQGGGINAHDLSHAPLHDADGALQQHLIRARVRTRVAGVPRHSGFEGVLGWTPSARSSSLSLS